MKILDIRSDTGTFPTDAMREAMRNAAVGDDVCKDDPTTNLLEETAAKMVGKERALFVPSGTFGNQLSLFTHCQRGEEVILEDGCHIIQHEAGAASIIAGVQLRGITSENGVMPLTEIEGKIRKTIDIHFPKTGLICLENALSSGKVLPVEYMRSVYDIAKKFDLKVHLDGARLFNAAVALNVDVKEITKYTDSVTFCLSKGLCAPIGSIVAGSKEFIEKAIFKRKIMGGGMRQTGVIAAPGIIAIKEMTKRLHIDHENARYLAEEISKNNLIEVFSDRLDINMIFFKINKTTDSDSMISFFRKNNILIYPPENGVYRFVTNNGIEKEDIPYIAQVMNQFLSI
ncbi:MAG: low-specificity L-threonine aldolase [Clostridia bacterium]|nr:low-specificity L-threonine aldolase [Clostridia bacterium]